MGLWQETAFLMVGRRKSHLDEVSCRLWGHYSLCWRGAAQSQQICTSDLTAHFCSVALEGKASLQTSHLLQEKVWNNEDVKRWEHFLASSPGCSPERSWHGGNQRDHSCCVPRQRGPALPQGDKRLLATVHLPTHAVNTSWPRGSRWAGSMTQNPSVLNKPAHANPSPSFAAVTSAQHESNITAPLQTSPLHTWLGWGRSRKALLTQGLIIKLPVPLGNTWPRMSAHQRGCGVLAEL